MRLVATFILVLTMSVGLFAEETNGIDSLQNRAIAKLIEDFKMLKKRVSAIERENEVYKRLFSNIYIVKTFGANVRDRPSLDSKVIRMYKFGDLVYVKQKGKEWSELDKGYIKNFIIEPALPYLLKKLSEKGDR